MTRMYNSIEYRKDSYVVVASASAGFVLCVHPWTAFKSIVNTQVVREYEIWPAFILFPFTNMTDHPAKLYEFIRKMIDPDEDSRPSMTQVLSLVSVRNIISKWDIYFTWDPVSSHHVSGFMANSFCVIRFINDTIGYVTLPILSANLRGSCRSETKRKTAEEGAKFCNWIKPDHVARDHAGAAAKRKKTVPKVHVVEALDLHGFRLHV